jgi:predicted polyphosphate/ATP-dependent NAD kinase
VRKIGLIVNPVAGIGGKVGLRGSDGEAYTRALELGARPESNEKAKITLQVIKQVEDAVELYTYPADMGGDIVKACGYKAHIIGIIESGRTRPEHTVRAAQDLKNAGVELLLFAGGDGTARNIFDAIGSDFPVLGIPAGCKIHSPVYALNPKCAGEIVVRFINGTVKSFKEAEVMDIDEELFRQNRLQAKLYGYLKVPDAGGFVQNMKSGRNMSEATSIGLMAGYIADTMEKDTLYIIGPGSTTRAIMDKLELPNTLLGVDLVYNGRLIENDVTEKQILTAFEKYKMRKIIVTVIGGQGYVFGRGNQQISAEVLRNVGKENIIIAATKDKMISLMGKNLYMDTGHEDVNEYLCGFYKVTVGYEDYVIFKLTY